MDALAVFPGTFDPITNGHRDLIRRAAALFPKVIVAVAANKPKQPALALEQRLELANTVLADITGVRVCGFEGLLADFANKHGARVIVRGLRAAADCDYEFQLAAMNKHMVPTLETVFLNPAADSAFISSSLVREIADLGGDPADFVHPKVAKVLKEQALSRC